MTHGQSAENTRLADLLVRIANEDRAAFDALYRALETPVYRFIRSKLNDPFESADILHDVFLEVWRSAGRFEGRSSVKSWVFGIAYRKVIDVFRKSARTDLTDSFEEEADTDPNPEQCLATAENSAHLLFCMETLKLDQRAAIQLAFFEDQGYREIAAALDVPEGTVKTRIFHAKKLLMRCLEGRRVTMGDV
ncbi:RNA polymerase sigma factor [Dinoroseobacter shibae DFL 12 = DSM 16493]|jgi:RNA polymerase sigma-70 factor (ECF subfamily)|uniref:RNA polymerase sigma factor n=1 Tax=Dinoroseobacter shibae (strain DSM 16493 / NCIMB 14021 / DFL 12) TaxID=398580 RepID=A8LP91_DINSH|nr:MULTISPECIES: RNA polymerase sigma factor [Dinoroseobacter]ABV95156.1 RNA polymerase sigma factor [Dinoroseobacter shibae DFL 12 = DSM 16493]MDD9718125.1 RNA polymerase sigma factor [Dinoroseobacter sp. PD6]URF46569.1 RNA polymerase sigma factor [Dinoroseobacter shibae]URF50875.1 RNA polymerase sigma factor [Dinoroseobacter shibae]